MAVRVPDPTAPRSYSQGRGTNCRGVGRRNRRGDPEHLQCDPQLREGASAAALAALSKERGRLQGRRAAVILTGQNIDRTWMQTVLAGGTPNVC